MNNYVFAETEFYALIVFSVVLPFGIYAYMMWKRAISRKVVLLFGLILIVISAIDVGLLRKLESLAKISTTLIGNTIFKSELSITLYLLPALFAGIGVNIVSHILLRHLTQAEEQFDIDRRN